MGIINKLVDGSINEAIINLVVSLLLVHRLGLTGVAIGTLFAMAYRTFYLINYIRKNIVKEGKYDKIKLFITDVLINIFIVIFSCIIKIKELNYLYWIIHSSKIFVIGIIICIIINYIINYRRLNVIWREVKKGRKRFLGGNNV